MLTYPASAQQALFEQFADRRVVKAESDQIVEKLLKKGHNVQYEIFEDEGHGFLRRDNLIKALKLTVSRLERGLLGN